MQKLVIVCHAFASVWQLLINFVFDSEIKLLNQNLSIKNVSINICISSSKCFESMIMYIDMITSHIDWSYSFNVLVVSPDVIFLAVNVAVSFETRELVGKFHPAV